MVAGHVSLVQNFSIQNYFEAGAWVEKIMVEDDMRNKEWTQRQIDWFVRCEE